MSTLQDALEHAKNYPIFPCTPDKTPLVKGGFKAASQAPAQITAWWQQFPNALIGIPTGPASGLLVVDIDRKNGHDGLATLQTNGWSIPLTRIQQTTSGGQHIFFRYPPEGTIRCSAGVLGDGIDIRAEGGYVIGWEAEGLPLLCEEPPAPLPEWLQTALVKPIPASGKSTFPAGTGLENPVKVRSALATLDPDMVYQDWVQVGMALHHATSGGTDGLALWDSWSTQGTKYCPGETAKKWESFGKSGSTPITLATLYKMATAVGWRWKEPAAKSLKMVTPPFDPPPAAEPPERELPPIDAYNDDPAYSRPTSVATSSPTAIDHWPRLEPNDKPPHITTDQANGYRLAQQIGQDLLYVIRIGWYAWHETHWCLGDEFAYRKIQVLSRLILAEAGAVTQQAAKTENSEQRTRLSVIAEGLTAWARKSEARDRIYAAMTLAKPMLTIEHGELDRDNWLLNCGNGVLDLRTGGLRSPHRDDFITRCLSVAYDPKATCPTWHAFLDRIFAGAADVIHFVQKAIGYTLTGDTSEQCVFFLWGTGQNGKSTLLSTLQALMGVYAQQAAPDLLVISKYDRHTTEVAELRGARLVASIETGDGRRLNEPLIKQMSGGDRMKGRFMRQDNIEFNPTHKVFLATNHKPKIRGTDHAIWRRIRLIPFTVTIPPEERDQRLPERLKAELSGILAWAVQGCLAWQREGLEPPKEVTDATAKYKAESDVLAAFLFDCCIIDENVRVKATDLYNAYRQWGEQAGERLAESQTTFGLRLAERGLEKKRLGSGWFYYGIGLQPVGYEAGEP